MKKKTEEEPLSPAATRSVITKSGQHHWNKATDCLSIFVRDRLFGELSS